MGLRTDLAREAFSAVPDLPGARERVEAVGALTVSTIDIETEEAAARVGKRVGRYVTIEIQKDARDDTEATIGCIASALSEMLAGAHRRVLVVGLGNRFVTPDSLGPRTVERIFVTRHIEAFAPELAEPGMRIVSAIAPGVLGTTGIESAEAVRALAAETRPDALLCIDALAASESNRIANTVQLNDSGLLPGAGVGNRQQGLDRETLGVPVYAIGVPTVVYASTIAAEAVHNIAKEAGLGAQSDALERMARAQTDERMGEMVVTPKDVDQLIEGAAKRLAGGINRALHGTQYAHWEALLEH